MGAQGTVSIRGFQKPLGFEQLSNASLAVAALIPNVPAFTTSAYVQAEGGDVRYRDDGTPPTATVGMLIVDGSTLEYEGDLSKLQVIASSNGVPKANVSFYK